MSTSYAVGLILDRYGYLTPEQVKARLRGVSFVSLEKRFLYCAIAKAACTSMKTLLHTLEGAPPIKTLCGGMDETRRDMFIHARENVPLPSLADLDDATQREVLHAPDFLRMTVVRSPYTRLLSVWRKTMLCEPGSEQQYLAIKGRIPATGRKDLITVAEFVDYVATDNLHTSEGHWALQHPRAFMDALDFNFVGRVENMAEVMQRFSQHLGLAEPIAVEHKNESRAGSIGGYDAPTAAKVRTLYAEDFARFDYSVDCWPAADPSTPQVVPEQKFCDEIVERNLLLSELYKEVYRLRADMAKFDRLHMVKLVSAITASRDMLRRLMPRRQGHLRQSPV